MAAARALALGLLLGPFGGALAGPAEVPALAAAVARGELPPVAERLPSVPAQARFGEREPGRYGGRLRLLMAKAKDTRLMTVYGYARLLAFDAAGELWPDILAALDNRDNRVFTLHLRRGHRWSDGQPFSAEDFRFYWEEVANNAELSPYGPPQALLAEGDTPPQFSVIDAHTVRFSWPSPNPYFLSALAGASPLYIYRPAHYLKTFHPRYQDADRLAQLVETHRKKNWRALFFDRARQYRASNPELPTLQPWINTTRAPAERFVFKRNPYFHRVDPLGRQLPYIDEVVLSLASSSLIPAKTAAGESDLQARYLRMEDYSFLKSAEVDSGRIRTHLWGTALGSQIALYPNLNAADPIWRELLRDVRFRRALSLGIDRHELNEVIYFGLARASANTVLPQCPLYEPSLRSAWSEFDLDRANALLDQIGLPRARGGIRQLPDGRPLELLVQTAGESSEQTDALQLVGDSWRRIGVQLFVKPVQREVLRNRVFSGQALMSVWYGLENAIPSAEMSPADLAPTRQDQLQWPAWGRHAETGEGEPPALPAARRLLALNRAWALATEREQRRAAWREMLQIHAEQVFTIGLVNSTLQPVVANPLLRNVPDKAVYNWDPGAHFGVHRLDAMWFADAGDKR